MGKESVHLSFLRALLFSPEIVLLFEGTTPIDIAKWFINPWLMPAVAIWCKILWKYSSTYECVDDAFMQDFNEISNSGIGAKATDIDDVDRKLQLLLAPVTKAFKTAQELCDHMRLCSLVKIIKTEALGTSARAQAWKLGDDFIIAHSSTTLLTINQVKEAITLVQLHLVRIKTTPVEEPRNPQALRITDNSEKNFDDTAALKANIAFK